MGRYGRTLPHDQLAETLQQAGPSGGDAAERERLAWR
jgi:hypothetical protein